MKSKLFAHIALVLVILELCLVPSSWVLSVLLPESGIRSMLGSEGVRWFFGRFDDFISGRTLAWLLLMAITVGCVRAGGLVEVICRRSCLLHYRERTARRFVICLSVAYVAVYAMLAFMPHAVLLSVSGCLFPSPFSASLVPVSAFGLCLVSIVCGIVSGRFRSVTDVYASLFQGIEHAAPLFLYYILLTQLYYSVLFVFG